MTTANLSQTALLASHPNVVGLTGKAKREAIKILHDLQKAAAAPAKKVKPKTKKELAEEDIAYKNGFHTINVVRETEKAVAIEVLVDFYNANKMIKKLAWIPKSIMEHGDAPGWIFDKKLEEIRAEINEELDEVNRKPINRFLLSFAN